MNDPSDPLAGLQGQRLGVLERTLLTQAPRVGTLGGLTVRDPVGDRNTQRGYLRAAKKLARLDLVMARDLRERTRARDPRREHPVFEHGRFWSRPDHTREHWITRKVIWATRFGEGIKHVYEVELTQGKPIRWRASRIRAARRHAERLPHGADDQQAAEDMLEEGLHAPLDRAPGAYREVYPEAVNTADDKQRWRLCCRVARREHPTLGSQRLWDCACTIYDSGRDLHALRLVAGRDPGAPSPSPLRLKRLEAGQVVSTPAGRAHSAARRPRGAR